MIVGGHCAGMMKLLNLFLLRKDSEDMSFGNLREGTLLLLLLSTILFMLSSWKLSTT